MPPSPKRLLHLRLIHDGAQPGPALAEPLRFGLQDAKGEVHPGRPRGDGSLEFDFAVEVVGAAPEAPVFRGGFTHGPKTQRFVYLSWKREGTHEHPWGWRIKMPLGEIGWAEIDAGCSPKLCLEADVSSRRPHKTGPILWRPVER